MSRGVFSADFASVFEDVLNIHFEDFPSASGAAPDPTTIVTAPGALLDALAPNLPVFDSKFDFAAPAQAALEAAGSANGAPVEAPPPSLPDLPADAFDFDFTLPAAASTTAAAQMPGAPAGLPTLSGAVSTDYGPLYAPGGGGGRPKPPVEPPSEPTLSTRWESSFTSGPADTATDDNFNMLLEFYGDVGAWGSDAAKALQGYLEAAAEFLSSIITTGFTNDGAMFNSYDTATKFTVDDLLVEVYIAPLSGNVAAATSVFAANDWDGDGNLRDPKLETPAGAKIIFNENLIGALDGIGVLDDTALHEMMHTLLFGVWENAENDLTTKEKGKGGALVYTGELGLAEYRAEVGDPSAKLLVEDEGLAGSVGGHWAEAAYDAELMTSVVENNLLDPTNTDPVDIMYLSYFSVASLQDLAVVNHDSTTGYQLAADWEAQVDVLNGTAGNGIGIDLDVWAASTLA
jgi:hypothetical protein